MINHSLLHPTMTDEELKKECKIADKYEIGTITIKPYAIKLVKEMLKESL